jgi:hypothetical protein
MMRPPPSLAMATTDRRVTGTVAGALGRALMGAISDRNGAPIGGVDGAFVGNQLMRVKCASPAAHYGGRRTSRASNARRAWLGPYASGYAENCRYENKSFYSDRGRLFYAPTRICGE